jgi:hypothetical protein
VVEILKEPRQRLIEPTAPRGGEEADPWVIALAEAVNATPPTLFDARPLCVVVSEESRLGGIADICRRRGVVHADFTEMLAAEVGKGMTTKTLRRRLFGLVGRLTRSARRLTLRLPARWPWAIGWSTALGRLRAIPLLA